MVVIQKLINVNT
ncbi:hypothetical protein FWK35_00023087 [Aphis craccivora]|uniref:Uncharacterized protein n=1 Tax=Aphis craccivora TaxID=307492 RepID=A0A6G0VX78_APHCR|nr:hypothetical protein FWK35_00023087 [Aphis craccivora]